MCGDLSAWIGGNYDDNKLLDQIEDIMTLIEEIAMDAEEGAYELPEPERND